jgi:hypothetical protein
VWEGGDLTSRARLKTHPSTSHLALLMGSQKALSREPLELYLTRSQAVGTHRTTPSARVLGSHVVLGSLVRRWGDGGRGVSCRACHAWGAVCTSMQ